MKLGPSSQYFDLGCRDLQMSQGETSPPSLLTEADLIALMDKHGIGTQCLVKGNRNNKHAISI